MSGLPAFRRFNRNGSVVSIAKLYKLIGYILQVMITGGTYGLSSVGMYLGIVFCYVIGVDISTTDVIDLLTIFMYINFSIWYIKVLNGTQTSMRCVIDVVVSVVHDIG